MNKLEKFIRTCTRIGCLASVFLSQFCIGPEIRTNASILHIDKTLNILVDDNPQLNFDEAAALTKRFHHITQILDLKHWQPSMSEEDIHYWIQEFVLQYAAEGATPTPSYPSTIRFVTPIDGLHANHMWASSDCNGRIDFSVRVLNPHSNLFHDEGFIQATAHEVAHIAQGQTTCDEYSTSEIETSAQIASLEVLAAMSVRGNKDAYYALISTLLDLSLTSSYVLSGAEHRTSDFEHLRSELFPSALDKALWDKTQREFQQLRIDTLFLFLNGYNLHPLQLILDAYHVNKNSIQGLALNIPGNYKLSLDEIVPPSFKIDDLLYVLEHAEEMAAAFAEQQ